MLEKKDGGLVLSNFAKAREAAKETQKTVVINCRIHGRQEVPVFDGVHPECPMCLAEKLEKERVKVGFQKAKANFSSLAGELVFECLEDKTFSQFEVLNNDAEKALKICRRFSDNFFDRITKRKDVAGIGIFFSGASGTGKTHLLSAIASDLEAQGFAPVYLRAEIFFNLFRGSSNPNLVIGLLSKLSCLIIDELGRSACTPREMSQLITVLDFRLSRKLPTVVATNVVPQDAKQVLGDAFTSRIKSSFVVIKANWPDYRQKIRVDNLNPLEVF